MQPLSSEHISAYESLINTLLVRASDCPDEVIKTKLRQLAIKQAELLIQSQITMVVVPCSQ
jgi:hypothetical protein